VVCVVHPFAYSFTAQARELQNDISPSKMIVSLVSLVGARLCCAPMCDQHAWSPTLDAKQSVAVAVMPQPATVKSTTSLPSRGRHRITGGKQDLLRALGVGVVASTAGNPTVSDIQKGLRFSSTVEPCAALTVVHLSPSGVLLSICIYLERFILLRTGVREHVWSPTATKTRGRPNNVMCTAATGHRDPCVSAGNSSQRRVHTHIVSPAIGAAIKMLGFGFNVVWEHKSQIASAFPRGLDPCNVANPDMSCCFGGKPKAAKVSSCV
jgi:hypothetical protein